MSQHRITVSRGFEQAAPSEYVFNDTISANTTNYDIRAAAIADGWDGVLPLSANVVINAGVYVYSTSTGTPAMSSNTSGTFPGGSTLTIVNNGTIVGRGGNGGAGAAANALSSGVEQAGGSFSGSAGGNGLDLNYATNLYQQGTISGGGGGGGGGGAAAYSPGTVGNALCGGGGGGGGMNGSGALKGAVVDQVTDLYTYRSGSYTTGTDGGDSTGITGGSAGLRRQCMYFDSTSSGFKSTWYMAAYGGNGGGGGSFASSGGTGGTGADFVAEVFVTSAGSAGGAGGLCITGTSHITWSSNTGTLYGSSSST